MGKKWMGLGAIGLLALASCAGKKRDFADGVAPLEFGSAGASSESSEQVAVAAPPITSGVDACTSDAECESGRCLDGACSQGSGDAISGLGAAALPSPMPRTEEVCGDACSGECAPGDARCASVTERIECGTEALWGAAVPCPFACVGGACSGECVPGSSECVTSTRARSCSDQGVWSEPADCPNACVAGACGGECSPGQTQCTSTTSVQTCSEMGAWGAPTPCQNACVGTACTGVCVPGATQCASETLLQTCNEQGQFLGGAACPFACVGGACAGECVPGSSRCNPANGSPQLCTPAGVWQTQPPCMFVCSGSGSCTGECAPGSRRCNPNSGIPQLCDAAGTWQSQATCPFLCSNGGCTGECTPGSRRCDPASGVPQLCSNAAAWQSQAACARGCQDGACIPQLGLGAACLSARDCTSGFCADGVCCATACQGLCAQCQPGTGACVMPATDTSCSPVSCPSNECQTSSGDIVANLCRSLGQCKNASDCSVVRSARGTPCDVATSDFRICDGSGTCVDPTVTCAGVAGRPVGEENVCCDERVGTEFPFDVSESYGRADACLNRILAGEGGTPITCDGDDDCRTGTVCCQTGASGGSGVSCLSAATCNTEQPFVNYREICGSPGGFSGSCPAGRTCTTAAGTMVTGWAVCLVTR